MKKNCKTSDSPFTHAQHARIISESDNRQLLDFKWRDVMTADGFVPADKAMADAGFACDSLTPLGSSQGFNVGTINSLAVDNAFLGWGELALLQQNGVVNNICSIYSHSMTEKWINITSCDTKNRSRNKINDLRRSLEKFKIRQLLSRSVYMTMLMGTSYISPKLKGDDDCLDKELILSYPSIGKGSVEDFYLIDPTWVVPVDFNMTNPRKPNFYKPQSYNMYGKTIDKSRMMQIVYIRPVDLLSPQYLFGGIPFIQTGLEYILDYLNTKKEIVKIISRFNVSILKTNINALSGKDAYGKSVTQGGSVVARANIFNSVRNNQGLMLINNGEEFQQIQIPLAGLCDVLSQQMNAISFIFKIPIAKLMGESPGGLNSTGEYDSDNFNQQISSAQDSMLREPLTRIMTILMLDLWGEVDKNISFDFAPLGALSEEQESQICSDEVDRAAKLVGEGIFSPTEMAEHLISTERLKYDNMTSNY